MDSFTLKGECVYGEREKEGRSKGSGNLESNLLFDEK